MCRPAGPGSGGRSRKRPRPQTPRLRVSGTTEPHSLRSAGRSDATTDGRGEGGAPGFRSTPPASGSSVCPRTPTAQHRGDVRHTAGSERAAQQQTERGLPLRRPGTTPRTLGRKQRPSNRNVNTGPRTRSRHEHTRRADSCRGVNTDVHQSEARR